MKTVHMMIGIPGSGKSTYALELSKKLNYKIISTDVVRMENPGIKEEDVWPRVYWMIAEELKTNDNVIYDATNVTKKVRDRFKENLNKYITNYQIKGYFLPTYHTICSERVDKRNKVSEIKIPLEVIASYGESVYPPTYEEEFIESKVISQLDNMLYDIVDDAYQGYALYYKHNDKIIEEYSGFADIETNRPVRANTNFRLASVTKQFIGYGILSLVKKNLLSLDDKLFDMFDDMPEYTKTISIRNMLNHTSGLLNYEDMNHTDEQIHDIDVLNYIRKSNKQYFETGLKYQYSNTAYVILGLIIEKVSNMNLDEYLKQEIFKPLNMNDTQFNYEPITNINNRAYGNVKQEKLVKKDQYWCSATLGDGGLYSNIIDLKKWLTYIQNLDEFYKQLSTTHIVNGVDIEYGMGLRAKMVNGHELVYHCGSSIGTNTVIGYIKDLDIEFILLTNCNDRSCSKFIDKFSKIL